MDMSIDLNGIVAGAVERQIAEQRALSERLAALEQGVAGCVREAVKAADQRLEQIDRGLADASADLRSLAEAVVDLSRATKEHVDTLEARIGALASTLGDGLAGLAQGQAAALDRLAASIASVAGGMTEPASEKLTEAASELVARTHVLSQRASEIESQVTETSEVTAYLRDQAEDFDRLLYAMSKVPDRLDAVVAQALRRVNAVRAGLVKEAKEAVGRAMEPVAERVDDLIDVLSVLPDLESTDAVSVRKLELAQIEMVARLDDLAGRVAQVVTATSEHHEEILQALGVKPAPGAKNKPRPKPKSTTRAGTKAAASGTVQPKAKAAAAAEAKPAAQTKRVSQRVPAAAAVPMSKAEATGAREPKTKTGSGRQARGYIPV